jgi:hypothetical protein
MAEIFHLNVSYIVIRRDLRRFCIDIPQDDPSIGRNMWYTSEGGTTNYSKKCCCAGLNSCTLRVTQRDGFYEDCHEETI